MAQDTWKLTTEQRKNVSSALRTLTKKISARDRAADVSRRRAGSAGGDASEVLVLVLGPDGAVLARTKVTRRPDHQTLQAVMLGANVAADRLARRVVAPSPPLTAGEGALLDEAGLVEEPDGGEQLERGLIEFDLLVRESLSLAEAARRLKVSQSRLRQRLSPDVRTLYGIKCGERAWRIPTFQFAKKGRLVRNIDKVLPRIRPDAHPLAVYRWFAEPHQDLVVGDEETPLTPLVWLDAGYDRNVVGELAAEI